MRGFVVAFVAAVGLSGSALAQQQADLSADLSVAQPAFALGAGPNLVIDAAHNNFHTMDGRYAPFAQLMRNDGFRVSGSDAPFSDASLAEVDVLVIANAVADEDAQEWVAPNPSAFSVEEIAAVRRFVERGGALWLIADHMPFGGAAQDLGRAFGVEFHNGFALDGDQAPDLFTRANGGLADDALTAGVRQVRNFTGSAFTATGPGVRPLLALDARWAVLLPQVAWQFNDATPRLSGANMLQGAAIEIGRGRVAIFAEAAMFSAQTNGQTRIGLHAPGAEDNKAFALAVAHWLAGPR